MKKFSQFVWNLYKNSVDGQQTIAQFKAAQSKDFSGQEMLSLAKKCNPRYLENSGEEDDENTIVFYEGVRNFIENDMRQLISNDDEEKTSYFQWFLKADTESNEDEPFEDLPQNVFKGELYYCVMATWAMCSHMPEAFIPNLFAFQFNYLTRFAHKYEIDLPPIPKRSAYKDRCMYYVPLNKVLLEYAHMNGITAPEEVCAFWFGLALPIAKEEIEDDRSDMPDIPEQAWLLVGNYSEEEKHMEAGFWQANPMTARGDVLMFYEKSPVKKMNSFWIAQDDGVADPFFHFYGYTYIGNKVEIPEDMAISYDDFKANPYFDVEIRGKEGNFVSKNFQDCSGWAIPFDDYAEIKRMLVEKGFDTSVMPSLYEPKGLPLEGIEDENDVYDKLVTPLLEEMGWKKGVDFKREVEFAAGHGTTGHAMNKRPDYCLHITEHGRMKYAKVVIEAKFFIKNNAELSETFDQCLTYASWGQAKVLVLCDKNTIYVYEPDRNGQFDQHHHRTRYRWAQLKNPEVFKELKRKLDI